jgi:aminoglycoside phosphotransferase family enzyme
MSPVTNDLVKHSGRSREAPLESDLIAALLRPDAYPHPVDPVELVETHISWVLLTGEFAYKVKKPVELGFLDFRELEQRRFFCEEEVRLNRFWAPELYLDVVPIGVQDGHPRIGGSGPAIEYAVRMRQFEQSLRLDHQLEAGRLTGDDMLEVAEEIAARHRAADRAGPVGRLLLATKKLMWDNFDDLIGEIPDEQFAALQRWTRESLRRHETKLRERCGKGFYRECHGDLHLGNLVRLAGGIKAFDCIEFSEELRQIDVVADHGFLVMDLVARGRTDLAYAFLNRYLEVAGDYDGVTLLPLYVVYRCLVRAKVAAIRRSERSPGEGLDEDTATLDHYRELAQAWTERRRLSGSGKTWLSTRLMTELPALRLRSDLERKRMFGFGETADSHSGIASGIYRPAAGEAVYARLLEQARTLLAAGFNVILDAAFLNLERRERARRLTGDGDADFAIVQTSAPIATLEQRLGGRTAAGGDPSEADLEVLRYQARTNEPLTAGEIRLAVTVSTEAKVDVPGVIREIGLRAGSR